MLYFLIALAIILALIGVVGAVVPGIAGTPFSFLALLALSFAEGASFSPKFLIIMGVIGAIVFAVDYVVPVWGTKHFGGTKAGVRGSTIGLFLGLLVTLAMPIGFIAVLLGPFIGAYIGEKNAGTDDHKAWRSAFGSFVGFLCGTGIKVIYACVCIYFIVKELIAIL
ncbi:MAG: DUF456 domain-containing protein [Bacteroidales bacterium]|jgi:uncharacterized protein YqgC (DUF456 family)|nr:DUF456 domain-containing protein [Bacteroidales bacterium]